MLKDYTGDGSRVLFISHPHLQHLKPDAKGRLWNNLVSSSVQKICVANGFLFFNATEALKKRSGSHPERFYWEVTTCISVMRGWRNIPLPSQRSWPRR